MADDLKGSKADSPNANEEEIASDSRNNREKSSRTMDEVMAENKRKSEKIQALESEREELRSSVDSIKEELAELREIASERDLTSKERKKMDGLQDDLESEVEKLRNLRDNNAWVKLTEKLSREESEKVGSEIRTDMEIMMANEYLEDKASDLEFKNGEELAKAIRPFVKNVKGISLYRRNVMAVKDYLNAQKRIKDLDEREKKLKEKEDEEARFRESGSRIPRDNEAERQWEQEKDPNKRAAMLVDLMDSNPAHEKVTVRR